MNGDFQSYLKLPEGNKGLRVLKGNSARNRSPDVGGYCIISFLWLSLTQEYADILPNSDGVFFGLNAFNQCNEDLSVPNIYIYIWYWLFMIIYIQRMR